MFTFIIILLFLCFLGWLCQFGKVGIGIAAVTLLLALHAWMCTNVSWYGEAVVAPQIVMKVEGGWLADEAEPLLGEEVYKCGNDETYCVTITDHKIYAQQYDGSPDIKIKVEPKNATFAKAKTTLSVKKVAAARNSDTPVWLSDSNFKDEITTLDKSFEYVIDGEKLRMNEHSEIEPTKYIITAKNKAGSTTKTLIVTKYPLYHACALYTESHPGRLSIDDIKLCKERAEYSENSGSSSTTTNVPESNSPSNLSKPGSSSTNSDSGSHCYHYEFGRCWDDIEDEAYESGMRDKYYGYEGGNYAPPSDCVGICEDIYEDAYYQGWGE